MKSNTVAICFAALVLLAACSKPTDTVIPTDMGMWEKELAPQAKKLTEEDREKLGRYMLRAKLGEAFGGKPMPVGMTIGEALKEQTKFEAERAEKEAQEAALKEKLAKERNAAIDKLNKLVTVTLLEKSQVPRNFEARRFSDEQHFRIGFQNDSDKAIAGVSGELKFIDIFDKEVGAVSFRVTETIVPGQTVVWNGSRDYNQFNDEHRAVWNLESGKYKTRFVPSMVVFADGTKLGMPD